MKKITTEQRRDLKALTSAQYASKYKISKHIAEALRRLFIEGSNQRNCLISLYPDLRDLTEHRARSVNMSLHGYIDFLLKAHNEW